MKVLLSFTLLFFITVYAFVSCKKDDTGPVPQGIPIMNNKAPVARAGTDLLITVPSCGELTGFYLDGEGSYDPDGTWLMYKWNKLRGPGGIHMVSQNALKTRVEYAPPGDYAFELQVTDAGYLVTRDTVQVSIKGTPKEVEFDMTATGTLTYQNNHVDYYACYYYYGDCEYYDVTNVQAAGTFSPLGYFNVLFTENADTAAGSYAPHSIIHIYQNNINSTSLLGTTTINLKKLYEGGGGNFDGFITVKGGSASRCQTDIFSNVPPLKITGVLDTLSRRATMRITGKAYF